MKYFESGKSKPFNGKRTLEALSTFVEKMSGPAVKDTFTLSLEEWIKKDSAVVVASAECAATQMHVVLSEAAEGLRDRFFFVQVLDDDVEDCVIEMVRLNGKERAVWDQKEPLEQFVVQEASPLVSKFDKFLHAASKRPVVYLFHEGDSPDEA